MNDALKNRIFELRDLQKPQALELTPLMSPLRMCSTGSAALGFVALALVASSASAAPSKDPRSLLTCSSVTAVADAGVSGDGGVIGLEIMRCEAKKHPRRHWFQLSRTGRSIDEDFAPMTSLEVGAADGGGQRFAVSVLLREQALPYALELIDIDFDGELDLQLKHAQGSGSNESFTYFRYDAIKHEFVALDLDLGGSNVWFDSRTRTVHTSGSGGYGSMSASEFKWDGGGLVRSIESESSVGFSSNRFVIPTPSEPCIAWFCGHLQEEFNSSGALNRVTVQVEPCEEPRKGDFTAERVVKALPSDGGMRVSQHTRSRVVLDYLPPLDSRP